MPRFVPALVGLMLVAAVLAGCAVSPGQFGASDAPALAAADDGSLASAKRSGLGVTTASGAQDVAADTSTRAPKGALADRDYSSAKLDPELALKLVNDYRAAKGLTALKLDARLTAAAKMLSRDLASTDRISHYGSDGSSPWDRVKRAGYNAKVAAENVGAGQASLEEVFKGWTESPGHNRNLLLPAARDMGIALAADPKTEFKTFWTLVVASSQ